MLWRKYLPMLLKDRFRVKRSEKSRRRRLGLLFRFSDCSTDIFLVDSGISGLQKILCNRLVQRSRAA